MSVYAQTKRSTTEDGTKTSIISCQQSYKKKNLEYVGFFTVDDRSNQLCDPISGQHAIWNLFKEMAPISLIRRGPTIPLVLFSW